ncbi:MAG: zinc-dependent metalloprotease [Candidatus Kapaibacterium sp.]
MITLADRKIHDDASRFSAAAQIVPLSVDLGQFRTFAGPQLRLADVPLAPGLAVDLDLEQFDLLEPGVIATATDDHGPTPIQLSTKLYRGKISGDESSSAYLAIGGTSVLGSVVKGGKTYEIATDWKGHSTGNTLAAMAYPLADVHLAGGRCGVNDHNLEALGFTREKRAAMEELMSRPEIASLPPSGPTIQYSVKGAFDGDYEYLQLFGGDAKAAADYMLQVIGRVSLIYETDMACQIRISYMNIWKTSSDPYNTAPPSAIDAALYEQRNYWHPRNDSIQRGVMNVFSGKNWQGAIGVGFVQALCNNTIGYAYCSITRSNPEQDIIVLAHEDGHVMGSLHTQSCTWKPEIDRCAAAEDGNCYPPSAIKDTLGTVMSYCSQHEFKFHPKCANLIRNKLQNEFSCVELARRLSVAPLIVYFPETNLNKPLDTIVQNFFQNNGHDPVTVQKMELSGKHADEFIITNPKDSFVVEPGTSRSISIKYLATSHEYAAVTLTVTHNGYNPAIKAGLEAYSRDRVPVLGMVIKGKPEINFTTRKIGQSYDTTMPAFFANLGEADLHVERTEIVGPNRFDFQLLDGTGPFDITYGGDRIAAKFRFIPTTAGEKLAYLRVTSNAPNKMDSIPLKGNAKTGPLLRLAANDLLIDFHNRLKREEADTSFHAFFYNGGSDSMLLSGYVDGRDMSAFTSDIGLVTLPPNGAADLDVRFYDTIAGIKEAFLVIENIDYETGEKFRYDTLKLLANIATPAGAPEDQQKVTGLEVSPNPAGGDVSLYIAPASGETGLRYSMVVTDLRGREMTRRTDRFANDGATLSLTTAGWPNGTYFIRVKSERGTRETTLLLQR